MTGNTGGEKGSGGPKRLALAGFVAIAVAFGPARNGYGLFLPHFREEFGLSVEVSGLIASGLQAGYLIALTMVGLLAARLGPRPLVMIGALSAGAGTVLVALAPNVSLLALGLVLAGTSAGWCWAPYNDAVEEAVPPDLRGRVLSIISTGTTFGIVVAGLAALAVGASWRTGWFAFAGVALVAAALNARALREVHRKPSGRERIDESSPRPRFRWFARRESAPLFATAFSFGVVSAFYWAFAVDQVARSGAFSFEAGAVFYVVVGLAGFAGLFTGDLVIRFGVRKVLATTLVALAGAAFLLGAAPALWTAVGVSAVLYGAGVMLMSALLSVWSSAVFIEQPSTGFSVTLLLFGLGSIVGPAAFGAFAGRFGLDATFLLAAGLAIAGTLVPTREKAMPVPPNPVSGSAEDDVHEWTSEADQPRSSRAKPSENKELG